MLNIVEDYLKIKNHKFLRLDGSTKVEDRYTKFLLFSIDKSHLNKKFTIL